MVVVSGVVVVGIEGAMGVLWCGLCGYEKVCIPHVVILGRMCCCCRLYIAVALQAVGLVQLQRDRM